MNFSWGKRKTVYRMMFKERKKQNSADTSRGVTTERNEKKH